MKKGKLHIKIYRDIDISLHDKEVIAKKCGRKFLN